jgi:hypothetical protein
VAEKEVLQAPPWLARLLTPLFARHIARELAEKHPGLTPQELKDKMRAEVQAKLGRDPTPDETRLIDEVVVRTPVKAEKPVSAWVLLAANLVPLAGVLLWDWDAFALLALFWMENVVVGVFFALRMLTIDPRDPALWMAKLFLVPFFCFHYGMFTAIHGAFVFSVFGKSDALRAASDYGLWLPIAVLLASHLFSFVWNYLVGGEFRRAQLTRTMMQPYARVIVLHVAIILGGIAATAFGSPVWALLVLVALKIALDLKAHVKEHSKP